MSDGIPSVESKSISTNVTARVFIEQTDAAACFRKAKLEIDPDNAKHFTVAALTLPTMK